MSRKARENLASGTGTRKREGTGTRKEQNKPEKEKRYETQSASYHLFTPEETVERAKSRLGETKYNLALNNCEHFAIWCKTGISESYQVKAVLKNFVEIKEKNIMV